MRIKDKKWNGVGWDKCCGPQTQLESSCWCGDGIGQGVGGGDNTEGNYEGSGAISNPPATLQLSKGSSQYCSTVFFKHAFVEFPEVNTQNFILKLRKKEKYR